MLSRQRERQSQMATPASTTRRFPATPSQGGLPASLRRGLETSRLTPSHAKVASPYSPGMSTVERYQQQERLKQLRENDFELAAIRTKIDLMEMVNKRTAEESPYDAIFSKRP